MLIFLQSREEMATVIGQICMGGVCALGVPFQLTLSLGTTYFFLIFSKPELRTIEEIVKPQACHHSNLRT